MAKPINPRTAYLRAQAEVAKPDPVLIEVFSALVLEIRADPELALGSGLAMDVTRKIEVTGTGGRPSGLMGALADVIITLAGLALEDQQANG
jgi:hypothetical protein